MSYYKVIRPKDNFEKFRTTANKWNFTEYIKKYILYDCMSFNKDGKEVKDMSLAGYCPWGCKRVRHDLATKQQQKL